MPRLCNPLELHNKTLQAHPKSCSLLSSAGLLTAGDGELPELRQIALSRNVRSNRDALVFLF